MALSNEAIYSSGGEERFIPHKSGSKQILERDWEQAKSSVVMIDTRGNGRGSGFLATFSWKPNCSTYLVTCFHVLECIESARKADIYFNRVKDDGVCIPARDLLFLNLFKADEMLDYFIIGVKEDILRQRRMDVKPLHFCSPDEVMKEGLIAYIIHHPGEGVDGPVGMARSFNSSVIAGFKDPIIAHDLHTEPGSSGSPLLIADENREVKVCGLHLGTYPDRDSPALFNRALYVHSMLQHLQNGKRPSSTKEDAVDIIAGEMADLQITSVVPLFLRLDRVQPDWDKNTILLACERHAPGMVSSVTLHREERAAFVRFKTSRATKHVGSRKFLVIKDILVIISLQKDPMEDKIHKRPSGRTIVISNIPRNISDQHLQLYLAGIGGQESPPPQRRGSQCLATFTRDCAEQLLKEPLEDSNNKKHYIQAHRLTPPDGIHVRNIENEQFRTFSYIEDYFNNEDRSGGKGVKSVTVGPNKSRIVVFKDPTTVDKVLLKPHSSMLGDNVELYRFHSKLVSWTEGSPYQVVVVQGRMEDCETAAYVNSPPSSLCLDNGPLAKSLRDAGGPDFITACKDYVAKHGNVKEGDIAVTVGGRMKCQHVIHAVGKEYTKDGCKEAEEIMSGVLKKVLEECERRELSSVSIPAIGAGVLKFPNSPLDIVNAVNSYLSSAAYSGRHLKRIVLVGRDAETFKEFRGLLEVIM